MGGFSKAIVLIGLFLTISYSGLSVSAMDQFSGSKRSCLENQDLQLTEGLNASPTKKLAEAQSQNDISNERPVSVQSQSPVLIKTEPMSDKEDETVISSQGVKEAIQNALMYAGTVVPQDASRVKIIFYQDKATRLSRVLRSPFVCEKCNKEFKFPITKEGHERWHDADNKYKCPYCEYAATRSFILKEHVAIHTKQMNYECPYCGKGVIQLGAIKRHIKACHSDKPLNFKTLATEAITNESVEQDEQVVVQGPEVQVPVQVTVPLPESNESLPVKIAVAPKCGDGDPAVLNRPSCAKNMQQQYVTVQQDVVQLNVADDEKPKELFLCKECPFSTDQKHALFRHVCSKHSGEKLFKCRYENCTYAAVEQGELNKHVNKKHPGWYPYTCGCGFKTILVSEFKKHQKKALAECGISAKPTNAKDIDVLVQEVNPAPAASATMAYSDGKCPFCNFSTTTPSNLQTHVQTEHQFAIRYDMSGTNIEEEVLAEGSVVGGAKNQLKANLLYL